MADAFDWKKVVGVIAPTLGAAFGGPMGGAAVKWIADKVLGNPDATETDIAAAFKNGQLTGEQIVALKNADQTFAVRMRELDIDILKLNKDTEDMYLKDVQDARARQVATKDYIPQAILAVFFVIYVGEVIMFFYGKMPDDEYVRALMTRAFGTVEAGLVGSVAYFIGTSRGSKQSGDTVRELAAKQQETISSAVKAS